MIYDETAPRHIHCMVTLHMKAEFSFDGNDWSVTMDENEMKDQLKDTLLRLANGCDATAEIERGVAKQIHEFPIILRKRTK